MRFFYLFFLLTSGTAIAQEIEGYVYEKGGGQPIENVIVLEIDSKKWAVTDAAGRFLIKVPKAAEINLRFRILGKQEKTISIKPDEQPSPLHVYLENDNLRLQEVVVTAKKGNDYSEVVIGEEAINQVQSFSLNGVLQQLPGQSITNINLNEFKPIVFRSVKPSFVSDDGFGNKSFGTAVVVDGIPISNNANMQSYAGNSSAPFNPSYIGFGDRRSGSGFNGYFSNANFGVDLRQISTQNIEKIEVVQGVPSAKYGDLTSGLIKIKQKAGRSPWLAYASLRKGTTEYGLNKGFQLNEKFGFLNLSANYLQSNANPRVSFTEYERINSQLMWSWANSAKTIRNTLSVRYGFNKDDVNYEAEDDDEKRVKNEQKDFSVSNRFKWVFNEAFFDHLDVNARFSYSEQFSYESRLVNTGGTVVGFLTEDSVYEGIYTAPAYTTIKAVEGIPISVYAAADVYKSFSVNDWTHNLSAGLSYRMSDNKGRGRLGSPETMSSVLTGSSGDGKTAFRPYNFANEVKAESQFSIYMEDQLFTYWNKNKFNASIGVRLDRQNEYLTLSPRVNTYFIHKNLKIRGGFGLTSKAPSLNQIYTGYRYYDVILGDFRLPGYYNIGVVQTFKEKENNPNVKPSRSLRTELGFDYKLPFATLNITGFYNKLYDGVTSDAFPIVRDLAQVHINDENLNDPQIVIDGYQAYYYTQSQLANALESEDIGVELFMGIPDIFRNLNLDIQGSYTKTKDKNSGDIYVLSSDAATPERFGVYKKEAINRERLKFGANLNYHIPRIGLVVAVRSEHFIFYNSLEEARGFPYAYINKDLEKIAIPEGDRGNTAMYGHIIKLESAYEENRDEAYHNFHLRVSKDFLNGFRFSFYANNFLDLKPTSVVRVNGQDVIRVNPEIVDLSFGTRIEYQF